MTDANTSAIRTVLGSIVGVSYTCPYVEPKYEQEYPDVFLLVACGSFGKTILVGISTELRLVEFEDGRVEYILGGYVVPNSAVSYYLIRLECPLDKQQQVIENYLDCCTYDAHPNKTLTTPVPMFAHVGHPTHPVTHAIYLTIGED